MEMTLVNLFNQYAIVVGIFSFFCFIMRSVAGGFDGGLYSWLNRLRTPRQQFFLFLPFTAVYIATSPLWGLWMIARGLAWLIRWLWRNEPVQTGG